MTEAEARRLAAEEGLVLVPADNTTGFKGVYLSGKSKPFLAQIRADKGHDRKKHHLGTYISAAEAALAVARFFGPAGCAAATTPASLPCAPAAVLTANAVPPAVETTADVAAAAALRSLQHMPQSSVPIPVAGGKRAREF